MLALRGLPAASLASLAAYSVSSYSLELICTLPLELLLAGFAGEEEDETAAGEPGEAVAGPGPAVLTPRAADSLWQVRPASFSPFYFLFGGWPTEGERRGWVERVIRCRWGKGEGRRPGG